MSLAEPVLPAYAAPAAPESAPSDTAAAESLVRPDSVSARVTARATGERVEVEGLRDEFTTTYVNPNGTWTTEAHSGQHRYRDDKGQWQQVDLTLEASDDGVVRPKGHPGGLTLSGGSPAAQGGTELLRIAPAHGTANAGAPGTDLPDGAFALTWPGRLPTPELDGERATYPEVLPGIDLVVEARRNGFEQYLVLKNRAAVVSQVVGGALAFNVGVRGNGISTRATAAGGLELVDAAGEGAGDVLWRVPPAMAWDAAIDRRSGDPANKSAVALGLVPPGQGQGGAGNGRGLGAALGSVKITPNLGWLLGANRQFPVTVDPTYASGTVAPSFDTFVQSNISSTDQSALTELRVGTYDGSTVARSFINFNLSSIGGLDIQTASLSLYNNYSFSCTASTVNAYQMQTLASTASRWSNQPAIYSTVKGSVSAAKGYSASCPGGRVSIPVTDLVQVWADAGSSASGISLRAASETATSGWKKFVSSEGSYDPVLTYTYNRKPAAASAPTVDNTGVYNSIPYAWKVKPTLRSRAIDPDGSLVQLSYEVHSSTAGTTASRLQTCTSAYVASGADATCTLTANLSNNAEVFIRAAVRDQEGLWNGTWSGWTKLRTAQSQPPAPTLSCPGYAQGSWAAQAPSSNVSCTVSTTGTGYSAPTSLMISIDGGTQKKFLISQAPETINFSVKNTAGQHTISAFTQNASTLSSTPTTLSFGYGGSSLTAPAAGTVTTGEVRVRANGKPRDTSTVTATIQARLAGAGATNTTAAWTTVDANPTVVNGSTGSSTAAVEVNSVIDVRDVIDPAAQRGNARIELRVCFTYTGLTPPERCTWTPGTTLAPSVLYVPHAFGGDAPTANAGPGQVALLTGEWNTSATDVSIGDLSLSRWHSTFAGPDTLADWPAPAASMVLGPGWTFSAASAMAGHADRRVVDTSHVDGTIAFVGPDGTALVFAPQDGQKRSAGPLTPGEWVPVDEETSDAGVALTVANTASVDAAGGAVASADGAGVADLALRSSDGTVTTFVLSGAPMTNTAGVYTPGLVDEPGDAGTSTFTRDGSGRVTRILAPVPDGVTCPAGTTLVAGCRALLLSYATTTTATSSAAGDVTGQLRHVQYVAWKPDLNDPTSGAMHTETVATYQYDASKRLVSVTDELTDLTTAYTYDGSTPRVKTLTPPGLAKWTLNYASSINGSGLQLASVQRANPDSETGPDLRTSSFVYGIAPSTQGTSAGLPDLSPAKVDRWRQGRGEGSSLVVPNVPVYGAAVFTGSTDPGTHDGSPSSQVTISPETWQKAQLQYATADGLTVNTAMFGAGAWQITADDFDSNGSNIRSFTAGALAQFLSDTAGVPSSELPSADPYATLTQYNAEDTLAAAITLADGTELPQDHVVRFAGQDVMHEWGPARWAVVDPDGSGPLSPSMMYVRPHVTNFVVQDTPYAHNIDPVSHQSTVLLWATVLGASLPSSASSVPGASIPPDLQTLNVTVNTYDALESSPAGGVAGPTSGWIHGVPTRTRVVHEPTGSTIDPAGDLGSFGSNLGSASQDVVHDTIFDSSGREIEVRQPSESGGPIGAPKPAGAGTIKTFYFSATTQTSPTGDPTCGGLSMAKWSGAVCSFGPAAAPNGGSGGARATTRIDTISWLGHPTRVSETSTDAGNTSTRIKETTFDAAGRKTQESLTLLGPVAANSKHVDPSTISYDESTGLVAETRAAASPETSAILTEFDRWGRHSRTETLGLDEMGTPFVDVATVAYDASDRLISSESSVGTVTYHYDGPDALNRTDYGDLPIRLESTTRSEAGQPSAPLVFKAAYSPDGYLDNQVLPGGISISQSHDLVGNTLSRVYSGPDPANPTATSIPWLSWMRVHDVQGRVVSEHTPNATSFSGDTQEGAAQFHRQYAYDAHGRLLRVLDRTADPNTPGIVLDDPGALASVAGCESRAYTFNVNGARQQMVTRSSSAGAPCPDGTAASSVHREWTIDSADRALSTTFSKDGTSGNASYSYDAFGRVTALPGSDTAAGDASLAYRDDDSVWKISVPSATNGQVGMLEQTFSYDAAGRRVVAREVDTSRPPTAQQVSVLTNHFDDPSSDNPAWSVKLSDGALTNPELRETTRYINGLDSGLAALEEWVGDATPSGSTVSLLLTNPNGDVTTTLPLEFVGGVFSSANGISSWLDGDEYGNPSSGSPSTGVGPARYGWHGADQRSAATPAGLVLMGARVYNPSTGLFTSVDPVFGGCVNAYSYPTDPKNQSDLSGAITSCKAFTHSDGIAIFTIYLLETTLSRSGGKMNIYNVSFRPLIPRRIASGEGRARGLDPQSTKGKYNYVGSYNSQNHKYPRGVRGVHFKFWAVPGANYIVNVRFNWLPGTRIPMGRTTFWPITSTGHITCKG